MQSQAELLFNQFQNFREASINSPEKAMMEYISNVLGSVEKVHFDFKTKRDRSKAKLDLDDKKNLCKAISGFANSSGGVLIWGIEDQTLNLKPIANESFLSNCLDFGNSIADPIVQGIDAIWIPCDSHPEEGFGIIYIPESQLPPHRVIFKDHGNVRLRDKYYIRSV